jgi:hypothetical protein
MKYFLKCIHVLLISALSSCLLDNIAQATQFAPLPIEKQVDEADFAAEATVDSVNIYRSATGTIMTDYIFSVNQGFAFDEASFHLDMPGGTLEGVTTMIDGGPQFIKKTKYFLLLKKVDAKIYLSNFTLGQYNIVKVDGEVTYRSIVFSNDSKIGSISKVKMKSLMSDKWGNIASNLEKEINLVSKNKPNAKTSSTKPQKRRELAQIHEVKSDDSVDIKKKVVGIFMFILFFMIFKKMKKQ